MRWTAWCVAAGVLVLVVAPGAAASHGPEAHLPMRDRGSRVDTPRSCRGVLFVTVERSRPVLWYLRAPGTSPKRVAQLGAGTEVNAAAVAPGGRMVALELEVPRGGSTAAMALFSRRRGSLGTARLLIAELRPRGRPSFVARLSGSSPSWSRDGRRLALQRGAAVLVTSSVAWSKAEFVTWGRDPAWSPAGNRLAFARDSLFGSSIFVATIEGTTRLTDGTRYDREPVWSPRGARILFARSKRAAGWEDLWIVPARGGPARRLTHYNRYNGARSPLWSAEGRHVAFTMANSEAWGARVLRVRNAKVSVPRHPARARGGLAFTRPGAWQSERAFYYEVGMTRRSLWLHMSRRRPVQVLERRPSLRVLDTGLCGEAPRR
ncbi:MAG TPA: hypothetical protein VHI71_00470 [Actinomycetota bacterium]|nr:hypothetical protein [Actinomycetota bacterium]